MTWRKLGWAWIAAEFAVLLIIGGWVVAIVGAFLFTCIVWESIRPGRHA